MDRTFLNFILFISIVIFSGCKNDNTVNSSGDRTENQTEVPVSNNAENGTITNNLKSSASTNNNVASKSLAGTSWQAFINVREPGDLYNYFIRYAEYHFEDSRMEFFANMVNASQYNPYIMREDSIFFNPNNSEIFQFKIIERSTDMIKVQAATGKQNTFRKISDSDMKLTRKERIQRALEQTNLFDKAELEAQFESIKDIKIN